AEHGVVTLEYGAGHELVDPFDVMVGRKSQQDTSGLDGRYLHPVVRWYRGRQAGRRASPDREPRERVGQRGVPSRSSARVPRLPPRRSRHRPVMTDYHERARAVLDPVFYDYFAGGAGAERAVAVNEEAFARKALVP